MKKITALTFLCVGLIWLAKAQQADKPISPSVADTNPTYQGAPQPDPHTLRKTMLQYYEAVTAKYPNIKQTKEVTPPVVMATELLSDGGFEGGLYGSPQMGTSGTTGPWGWTNSENVLNPIMNASGHTGMWAAYFWPSGPIRSQLYQKVSIPAENVVTLSFWLFNGGTGSDPTDVLGVKFCKLDWTSAGSFVKNYPPDETGTLWVRYSYDVSALAGQTVYLLFWTDIKSMTVYVIDDISLSATQVSGPTPTPTATPTRTATRTATPTPTGSSASNSKVVYSSGTAHAAGSNGAFWMTDMTFANGSTSDLLVKVFLDNASGSEQFGFSLPAGSSRTMVDVVHSVGLQDGSYVFRTEASCPVYAPACSVDQFSITARTYSQGYGGWFGTSLPGMASFTGIKTLAFQEISNSRKALYVFGTPTLAIAYDKNGVVVSTFDLGMFSAGRLTRVPLGENVSHIRISVSPMSFCYGTQVDNATQSQIIIQ